jgi:hypothetical protein
MRFLVATALGLVVAAGGPALAQITGQPVAAHTGYTIEPFSPPAQVTIQGTGVRLRAEPFATPQAQVLSSGSTGLLLDVVGIARMADWNWYQVVLKNGQKAFIRSDLTSAPSRGSAGAPLAAPAPVSPAPVSPMPISPPPTASAPYLAPQPIQPPPIQLAPPVALEAPIDQPRNRDPLDLPRPSDPPGLQSH